MRKLIITLCFLLAAAFTVCFYYAQQLNELQRNDAEQADVVSKTFRGLSYKNGYAGVEQDYSEAVKWFRKAAEQGYGLAQYNLGLCYAEGKGVEQDYVEALKWFRKAAEQGYTIAQKALDETTKKLAGTDDSL